MFDNRQLAALILIGAVIFFALLFAANKREVRKSLAGIFKQLLSLKILPVFVLYFAWLVAIHWFMWRVGLWDTRLVGESLFWTGAAMSLLFAATKAGEQPRFFRSKLFDTIKLAVFFEFFINIKPLSLWLELILQPLLAFLIFGRVFTEGKEQYTPVNRLFNWILGIIGLALTTYTLHWVATSWNQIDKWLEFQKLLMPIWLTVGALPFIYIFALVSGYELIFKLMKPLPREDRQPPPIAAKLGVLFALLGHVRRIHLFRQKASYYGMHIRHFRDGITAVREVLDRNKEREAEEQEARDHLEKYAGVDGTNEDGRRLDQREFEETKKFLLHLASCQMGWYRNRDGRYRSELLKMVTEESTFDRYKFPEDHGIVMKVRPDGQAWCAYRRTVTGWILGIGAKDKPSDQWFYDAPEPPKSFPKPGNGWGGGAHWMTVNWE